MRVQVIYHATHQDLTRRRRRQRKLLTTEDDYEDEVKEEEEWARREVAFGGAAVRWLRGWTTPHINVLGFKADQSFASHGAGVDLRTHEFWAKSDLLNR